MALLEECNQTQQPRETHLMHSILKWMVIELLQGSDSYGPGYRLPLRQRKI